MQAIDTRYKYAKPLDTTYPGISTPLTDSLAPSTSHWWAGVGNGRSIFDVISGCINIGQRLAEKRNTRPGICHSYSVSMLPENYMCLSAPHENNHPSKINTHSGC